MSEPVFTPDNPIELECPICHKVWTPSMFEDYLLPSCGCYGNEATRDTPCEPCGISHWFNCPKGRGESGYENAPPVAPEPASINPNGYLIRLLDGPYAGKEIILKPGVEDPADEIVVATSEMVAPGVVYYFNRGARDELRGDQVYRVRNRSALPPDFESTHVVRGAEYTYVGEGVVDTAS